MDERVFNGEKGSVCAVLLAAGSSRRMGSNKQLMTFGGRTPIELCLSAFAPFAESAVVVVSEDTASAAQKAAAKLAGEGAYPSGIRIVLGGERRQDSVLNALTVSEADFVAVHDCARCLVTPDVIEPSIACAFENGCGVASVRSVDTLRLEASGAVVDRESLLAAQTPQTFLREKLLEAYEAAGTESTFTDDAAIWAAAGNALFYSPGSRLNFKLTTPEDAALFAALLEKSEAKITSNEPLMRLRVGFGEDTHRLVEGRKLILGGVEIPFQYGLLGNSDADVLTHALIDAVLGACALGDIGQHFPDSDPAYKGVNSLLLARSAAASAREHGFILNNLDATLVCQRPKLAAYRNAMRENLAEAFSLPVGRVSVKFTTPEHTGPEGRGESITARAAASVLEAADSE